MRIILIIVLLVACAYMACKLHEEVSEMLPDGFRQKGEKRGWDDRDLV